MTTEIDQTVVTRVAQREARIKHFGEAHRKEVLLRSGDAPDGHARAKNAVIAGLMEEGSRSEQLLVRQFAAAFVAERCELEASKRTLESLGELSEQAAPAVVPAAIVPESVSAVIATQAPVVEPLSAKPDPPSVQVPTYLQEPQKAPVAAFDPDATLPPIARHESTLPFAGGRQSEMREALQALLAESRAKQAEADAQTPAASPSKAALLPEADETAFLFGVPDAGPATPFDAKAGGGGLTLAAYASFLADLSRDTTQAAPLRVKHGIADEAEQRAIGSRFAEEFQRDPSMRARFDIFLAQAKARLAR